MPLIQIMAIDSAIEWKHTMQNWEELLTLSKAGLPEERPRQFRKLGHHQPYQVKQGKVLDSAHGMGHKWVWRVVSLDQRQILPRRTFIRIVKWKAGERNSTWKPLTWPLAYSFFPHLVALADVFRGFCSCLALSSAASHYCSASGGMLVHRHVQKGWFKKCTEMHRNDDWD